MILLYYTDLSLNIGAINSRLRNGEIFDNMITIHRNLYDYLRKYCTNEMTVNQILCDNGMTYFFEGYIQGNQCVKCDSTNSKIPVIVVNRLRYIAYRNALTQIKSLFNAHEIPFVVMKGLALATELYGNQPYLRGFSDMDILISPQHASLALSLLKSIGFTSGEEVSVETFLISGDKEHHFSPLVRREELPITIILEVHVSLVPGWIFHIKHHNTEQILARSYVNEFGIPVMDDYDTILFLILHLVKHYVYPMVMDFTAGNENAQIDLRSFHEIAAFLYKKRDMISKVELEERVNECEARNEIAFVSKLLREVYPPLKGILDIHFQKDARACFSSRFSAMAVAEINAFDVFLGNKRAIICHSIMRLQENAFTLPCYPKVAGKTIPDNKVRKIIIDGAQFFQDNRFGTYKNVMETERATKQSGIFYTAWDADFFWFHITIKDEKLIFPQYNDIEDKPTIAAQDYIRLHFDTGKRGAHEAFVRGIVLKPQYIANGVLQLVMREDIYLNRAETVVDKCVYRAEINMRDNSCTLLVGISWHMLGYKPYPGFSFFFDVQMWDYDEKMEDFVVLAWQNANKAWYDITTYGRIELRE